MKISRWIYFPLIFVLIYMLQSVLMGGKFTIGKLLFGAIMGAIVGFVTLWWSESRAKKITGSADEEIYQVRQKRNITILLNFDRAFEVCKEAVNSLNPAKIKEENAEKGIIKFRTRLKWDTFGHIITVSLKSINENLTEVEISTRPIPRTVLVGSGYSWKYVEEICNYLKEKDAEINKKVLVESAAILNDIYVKPFQKEKIER